MFEERADLWGIISESFRPPIQAARSFPIPTSTFEYTGSITGRIQPEIIFRIGVVAVVESDNHPRM